MFHYWALYVLAATFAAGLVWWAGALVLLGPVLAFTTLVLGLLKPRQLGACAVTGVLILIYVAIWAPIIPRLSWQPHG